MQAPFIEGENEDYFANASYSKSIECILPTSELLVNFKANGIRNKRPCFVYAEKMDFKGLIQIRLAEKCDQRRMYITTVDSASFPELKQDQSLHVTFSGFVDNLVNLLQDSQAGKLEIFVVQSTNKDSRILSNINASGTLQTGQNEYQLQFLEMRPFKNLMHLCLPCRLAPLGVVLFYMNSIMEEMQKKVAAHGHANQQMKHELVAQQRRNEQLEAENMKLREDLQEKTNNIKQRHVEELQQLQERMQKARDQWQNDTERNRKALLTLQAQIEKLNMEKSAALTEKNQESKRLESLREELANSNATAAQLKTQKEQLMSEIASLKNEERKTEMHLNDARKLINELQDKLKKHDKNKSDIVAELEAEKKISQTKRQALEVATEEISKANEIIYKQAQELLKLKKTVEWRTEIALAQEKEIKEKESELLMYEDELKQTKVIVNSLREEVPQQLQSLRDFANSLESKYKEEIRALRDSLQQYKSNNAQHSAKASTLRKK